MKYYYRIGTLLLGSIFCISGIIKFFDVSSFLSTLKQLYGIPTVMIPFIATFLPITEILVGIFVIMKKNVALYSAIALNSIFLFILLYNYFLGNTNVNCGCFGDALSSTIDRVAITKTFLLFVINLSLLVIKKRI